jgi:hypothetical protein
LGVGGGEFGGQISEIGKGEFAGIGAIANAEEADIVLDRVAIIWLGINSI